VNEREVPTSTELLYASLLAMYDQLQAEYHDPGTEHIPGPSRGRDLYVQLCALGAWLEVLRTQAMNERES
jgi:hypothetical protein